MKKSMHVYENVYQIAGSSVTNSSDCCVYLIDTGDKLVLIDSGVGQTYGQIIKNIENLNLNPEKIGSIIVTHGHIDHIGGLSDFKKNFDIEIIAHEPDTEWIETGKNTAAEMYNVDYKPVQVDTSLKGERESIKFGKYELNFLHIPGHTPGSIACFFNSGGKKILFGQDIHGPYTLPGSDREEAERSLQKLLDLEADILCEGHSSVFRPSKNVEKFIKKHYKSLKK